MSFRSCIAATTVFFAALITLPCGAQTQGGFQSGAQSVALVAQLSSAAQVGWSVRALPQSMLSPGQSAEIVVLQESWTLGLGQTLDANCRVVTEPGSAAEFLASQTQSIVTAFASANPSVGARQERMFPLTNGPIRGGSASDSQSIVIFGDVSERAPSGAVRITVVAL
jgi:hypothetical protein